MQNFGKWMGASAIVVAALTVAAGCNSQGEANGAVADQAVKNATTAASNEANAAAGVASNVAAGASNTANSVAGSMSNTASTIAGALLATPIIKAKIINNPILNNMKNKINVESDSATVTLKGTVQSAAQKTLAGNIAKQNAGGRAVKNELTVAAA